MDRDILLLSLPFSSDLLAFDPRRGRSLVSSNLAVDPVLLSGFGFFLTLLTIVYLRRTGSGLKSVRWA